MKNVRMSKVVTVKSELEMALISEVAEERFEDLKWWEENEYYYEYRIHSLEELEEYRRDLEEDERIREELREWLRTHDSSDPEYSDIFKDVYGSRPRW